ncbi:MAG: dolichol kinase [Desulfurococcales archaeon]|nr:dolichol kinase [Desulfurococcales archaeon]
MGASAVTSISKHDIMVAAALSAYVLIIVYTTKPVYDILRRRGTPHNVAVYYNRKIIHILAGGVVAFLVPFLFSGPLIPMLMAFMLGAFLYYWHWKGRLLYWFQTEENMYEVNFTIAWGLSLFLLWTLTDNAKISVVPAVFIAIGDGVTGIIRNAVFARRTKHWLGNIGMLAVVVPLGYALAGGLGAVAGVLASIVERFEFPPIDDNLLVAFTSLAVLLIPRVF